MAISILTLSIEDAGGRISPISVYVETDAADTVGDLESLYIEAFWDVVRPLITGVLVDATISVQADISGFTNNTPNALSDVAEKAAFNFITAPPRFRVRVSLPTVKETIFTLSGEGFEVDNTNSDVIAFYAVMTDDLAGGGINAVDKHGRDISLADRGIQYFKG